MKDGKRTEKELVNESPKIRQRTARLATSESKSKATEKVIRSRAKAETTLEPEIAARPPRRKTRRKHAAEPSSEQQARIAVALQELSAILEEFQVAGMEPRPQKKELAAARHAAEAERRRYQELFEFAPDAYLVTDVAGIVQEANRAAAALFRVPQFFLIGKPLPNFVTHQNREDFQSQLMLFRRKKMEHRRDWEVSMQTREGEAFPAAISVAVIRDLPGKVIGLRWMLRDITERKRAEKAFHLYHRCVEIANRHTEMAPVLKEFVTEVRNLTGCAAVGLRILDEEGNIPYQAYEGFSQKFYERESPLSIQSDQCMCINVVKGKTDPKLPFYTEGGSFYINATTRFLSTLSEEERSQTRNECNRFGYESVALLPIRLGRRILGVIHVADPRENMVPLKMVKVLEDVAMQLGTAIQRVWAEEEKRRLKA